MEYGDKAENFYLIGFALIPSKEEGKKGRAMGEGQFRRW